ncbi:MAG: type IV pilus assembly protein PilM, partial [Sulfurifustis sp.]
MRGLGELLFARKQPPLVGIDISSSAVKVLELSKDGEQCRVERYAVEPLPQNAVVEHAITEVNQVADAVERAVKRSGTRVKHAAVAVPAAHVITKIIKMPANLSDDERQTQIEMEADHHIPFPIDEVNLDYQVLDFAEAGSTEVDVLMAACRKEIVDDYLAVIQGHGMTPAVVDIETYAMENSYSLIANHMPGGGMEKTVAILDIGAMTTTINVMHNNRSVY